MGRHALEPERPHGVVDHEQATDEPDRVPYGLERFGPGLVEHQDARETAGLLGIRVQRSPGRCVARRVPRCSIEEPEEPDRQRERSHDLR